MTTRTVGYLAFLFLAIYLFLKYVIGYVMPFVIGVALALLLEPVVRFFSDRFRLKRASAAALTVTGLIAIAALLASWGVTRIAAELTDLYRGLPDYYVDFNTVLSEVLRIAGDISAQLPEPLARVAQEQWNRIYSLLSVIVTGAGGVFWGVPGFAVSTIFTILSTYFAMRDRPAIGAFIRSVVPDRAFQSLRSIEMDILGGIAGFVRAQVILVLLTAVANVIGLRLLGSRYAVAIGLLLSLLDILPIVGPGLLYLPWILYHLIWGEAGFAVGLLLLYGIVSAFRQVVQTHLVGRELGLHPLVTLISIYAGFRLFGTPGLIYGPLTALLVKGMWATGLIPHEGGADR
ncbi:MAG TPA: sporulation integral membrane protein YtvI [Firmicutes bacterium]|nr:sporulation integral membrane protein YtvI [Candidatus Fermentithermobacillaceae bacterium]